jgi:2-keto-4-pentenoate hydratase/2-oxohepta-3-ene-1,7-dioic acid hydratase in catechol pathway
MRLVRFQAGDKTLTGRIEGKRVLPVDGETFAREYLLEEVRLLAPCSPSKVVAVGLNYRDHAEEMKLTLPDEPLLFLKPSTSVIGSGDPIILPPQSQRVDYEAELAVVIAKTARNVSYEKARDYVLGYTCLNDVTARDLQQKDGQWTRAKGFDTFCPVGPWIETDIDPSDLAISLVLNSEVKQQSRTSNLIFDTFRLVEFISHIMTLMPGDVIATGTTSGIGPMKQGDTVEVRVDGIGSLINPVHGGNG